VYNRFRFSEAKKMEITIAHTVPVAYGALGTPIIALAAVTGYSEFVMGVVISVPSLSRKA
jgi:L-lactate permease